ncbi:MAG: MBL fold metallo-hydrolase [Selenomonadaceae bacterium]|nr:MBL fold metallo-hydrolase [Selenomonadaceae bacterium]
MRKYFLLPLFLLMIMFSGCGTSSSGNSNDANSKEETATDAQSENTSNAGGNATATNEKIKSDLKITMLNVGQGDSFLIQTSTQNILIDTSDVDERSKLVSELDKAGVNSLDKIILTHPHADHIGGLEKLLKDKKFTVKEVFDNGIASTSKLYLNYMTAIKENNVKHSTLKAGDTLNFGGNVKFEVLFPNKNLVDEVNGGKQKSDPNNESIVGRLHYKNFTMMFTGDAELKVESEIWQDNKDKALKSSILKAGHHGSHSSSSENFVRVVNPQYVLISAGEPTTKRGGNTYGHPHLEPLETYLNQGIDSKNILWSWKNGTVVIETDGNNFSVTPEVKEDWVKAWIKEKKSQK